MPALREPSRSRRSSTSSIARTRSGFSASCCIPARAPAGTEQDALRLVAEALRRRLQRPAAARTHGAARAHRRPGPDASVIASSTSRRSSSTSTARRASACASTRAISSRRATTSSATRATPRRSRRSSASSASIGCGSFHANDSKRPCGSRVDRHEHIGEGCLGLEPFRRLLHDRRFAGLPLLIETEKSAESCNPRTVVLDALDVRNLDTLRRLRDEPATYNRNAIASEVSACGTH